MQFSSIGTTMKSSIRKINLITLSNTSKPFSSLWIILDLLPNVRTNFSSTSERGCTFNDVSPISTRLWLSSKTYWMPNSPQLLDWRHYPTNLRERNIHQFESTEKITGYKVRRMTLLWLAPWEKRRSVLKALSECVTLASQSISRFNFLSFYSDYGHLHKLQRGFLVPQSLS